jgi:hypothetical protein
MYFVKDLKSNPKQEKVYIPVEALKKKLDENIKNSIIASKYETLYKSNKKASEKHNEY